MNPKDVGETQINTGLSSYSCINNGNIPKGHNDSDVITENVDSFSESVPNDIILIDEYPNVEVNVDEGGSLPNYDFYDYVAHSHRGYSKVEFVEELQLYPVSFPNHHLIGGIPCQLNPSSWLAELEFENDMWLKSYIHSGIINGFDIVDDLSQIVAYARVFVDNLITTELDEGKYILSSNRPRCVHSLGAQIFVA